MYNKAKVQAFIRTLSDEEINSQVGDLFAFMEEYKQLLIEEQAVRRHNNSLLVITDMLVQRLRLVFLFTTASVPKKMLRSQ